MKKFDGINKYSYDTIFGIINIVPIETEYERTDYSYKYVVQAITTTCISYPVSWTRPNIGGRIFQSRALAYQYIKSLEQQVIPKINELLTFA